MKSVVLVVGCLCVYAVIAKNVFEFDQRSEETDMFKAEDHIVDDVLSEAWMGHMLGWMKRQEKLVRKTGKKPLLQDLTWNYPYDNHSHATKCIRCKWMKCKYFVYIIYWRYVMFNCIATCSRSVRSMKDSSLLVTYFNYA